MSFSPEQPGSVLSQSPSPVPSHHVLPPGICTEELEFQMCFYMSEVWLGVVSLLQVSELGQVLHGLSEAEQRTAPALGVSPGDCSFQHSSLESEASWLSNNSVI